MPVIHQIKDFKLFQEASSLPPSLSTITTTTKTVIILNGTSTIVDTTNNGQINTPNVPTTITITLPGKGNAYTEVAIFPDPSKVNYEFGRTPLQSLVRNYDPSISSNLFNIPMC